MAQRFEVNVTAGVYTFQWKGQGVVIQAERIREHSDRTTAEIVVKSLPILYTPSAAQGVEPLSLYQGSFNLGTVRTRNELARALNERCDFEDDGISWAKIIEEFSSELLRLLHQPEPVVRLANGDDAVVPFLIPGLLAKNQLNILYGPGGAGKSFITLWLAVLVQNGLSVGGFAPEQTNVLYLDWETGREDMERRVKAIKNGLSDLELESPFYMRASATFADSLSNIAKVTASNTIGLLIVDSLGPACAGDMKEEAVFTFHKALRQLGPITCLAVSHITKEERKGKGIRLPFGCYSWDTEVMTKAGWKRHDVVSVTDEVAAFDLSNKTLHWEKPTAIHSYSYSGPMVRLNSASVDALVTPEHRMVIRPRYPLPKGTKAPYKNPRGWSFRMAKSLGASDWPIPFASPFKAFGSSRYTAEFAQFLGWWLSEGCLDGNAPVLTQRTGELSEQMKATISCLGYEFKEWQGRSREHETLLSQVRLRGATKLGRWLRSNCGEGFANKKFPKQAFELDQEGRRALFNALMEGDGHWYRASYGVYSTSSKHLANDFQWLAITLGYSSRIFSHFPRGKVKSPHWTVAIDIRHVFFLRQRHQRREPYTGKVYCLTLPSGAYLTRRNGRTLIAGNSIYFENLARLTWEIKAEDDEDREDTKVVGLFNRKTNVAHRAKPIGLKLWFDDWTLAIERTNLKNNFAEEVSQAQSILTLLKEGAKTSKEISEFLEMPAAQVKVIMFRLKGRERVVSLGDATWGLKVL